MQKYTVYQPITNNLPYSSLTCCDRTINLRQSGGIVDDSVVYWGHFFICIRNKKLPPKREYRFYPSAITHTNKLWFDVGIGGIKSEACIAAGPAQLKTYELTNLILSYIAKQFRSYFQPDGFIGLVHHNLTSVWFNVVHTIIFKFDNFTAQK